MFERPNRLRTGRETVTGSARAEKVASHPPQAGRQRQGAARGLV